MGDSSRDAAIAGVNQVQRLDYLSSNGLPKIDFEIPAGRWSKAESRVVELLARIKPSSVSLNRRAALTEYVQRLIQKCCDCKVYSFGSVPLKTYLPDGDIDLTAVSIHHSLKDSWASEVQAILKGEQQNPHAEFSVREVQYIQAEVKLIKCLVDNIVVDISFDQLGGLCTLCFLEEVDQEIKRDHLFKRSIILVKAWCYYESRILGAHHGLISTYALETLVLYIFQLFHSSLNGPLQVLLKFLEFFSAFDWNDYCLSIRGPVPIVALPKMTPILPPQEVSKLLLQESFLEMCAAKYGVASKPLNGYKKPFPVKFMNVVDPLLENNNLGRSVNKGNFFRIRSAFSHGARKLAEALQAPDDSLLHALDSFFANSWDCNLHEPQPVFPLEKPQKSLKSPPASVIGVEVLRPFVESSQDPKNYSFASTFPSVTKASSAAEPLPAVDAAKWLQAANGIHSPQSLDRSPEVKPFFSAKGTLPPPNLIGDLVLDDEHLHRGNGVVNDLKAGKVSTKPSVSTQSGGISGLIEDADDLEKEDAEQQQGGELPGGMSGSGFEGFQRSYPLPTAAPMRFAPGFPRYGVFPQSLPNSPMEGSHSGGPFHRINPKQRPYPHPSIPMQDGAPHSLGASPFLGYHVLGIGSPPLVHSQALHMTGVSSLSAPFGNSLASQSRQLAMSAPGTGLYHPAQLNILHQGLSSWPFMLASNDRGLPYFVHEDLQGFLAASEAANANLLRHNSASMGVNNQPDAFGMGRSVPQQPLRNGISGSDSKVRHMAAPSSYSSSVEELRGGLDMEARSNSGGFSHDISGRQEEGHVSRDSCEMDVLNGDLIKHVGNLTFARDCQNGRSRLGREFQSKHAAASSYQVGIRQQLAEPYEILTGRSGLPFGNCQIGSNGGINPAHLVFPVHLNTNLGPQLRSGNFPHSREGGPGRSLQQQQQQQRFQRSSSLPIDVRTNFSMGEQQRTEEHNQKHGAPSQLENVSTGTFPPIIASVNGTATAGSFLSRAHPLASMASPRPSNQDDQEKPPVHEQERMDSARGEQVDRGQLQQHNEQRKTGSLPGSPRIGGALTGSLRKDKMGKGNGSSFVSSARNGSGWQHEHPSESYPEGHAGDGAAVSSDRSSVVGRERSSQRAASRVDRSVVRSKSDRGEGREDGGHVHRHMDARMEKTGSSFNGSELQQEIVTRQEGQRRGPSGPSSAFPASCPSGDTIVEGQHSSVSHSGGNHFTPENSHQVQQSFAAPRHLASSRSANETGRSIDPVAIDGGYEKDHFEGDGPRSPLNGLQGKEGYREERGRSSWREGSIPTNRVDMHQKELWRERDRHVPREGALSTSPPSWELESTPARSIRRDARLDIGGRNPRTGERLRSEVGSPHNYEGVLVPSQTILHHQNDDKLPVEEGEMSRAEKQYQLKEEDFPPLVA